MSGALPIPPPGLHPDAVRLIRRMTGPPPSHERFVGERIEFTDIDPLILGDVWSVAEAAQRREKFNLNSTLAGRTAEAIVAQAGEGVPIFRGAACRDYLDLLSREAEKSIESYQDDVRRLQRRACFALIRCADLSFDDLRPSAERFLATPLG